MNQHNIAIIPGDGIGHEIIPQGVEVLKAVAKKHNLNLHFEEFGYGAGHYLKHGNFMPTDGLEQLKKFDAIYFGAVGLPQVDDTLPFKHYTAHIRYNFEQYANPRYVKLMPGIASPLSGKKYGDIDFVIIRENSEGEFVQAGGHIHPSQPHGLAIETSVFTRTGVERIAHYAFKTAMKRKKQVITVTKSNTLIHSLTFWDRVIGEVAEHYPEVSHRTMYQDAVAANFILRPEMFDVVIATNMMGDVLSDMGGALMGSLGCGSSGNVNPERKFPSMFEPIHGSAPDIAGKGIANPVGTIWSGALLLDHLGESEAANTVVAALEQTLADGIKTKDLGGQASTSEVGAAVVARI